MKEFNLFSLKGKVITVVGATAGLGMRFVEAFAASGADLALIDIPVSEAKLEELATRIGEEYQVKTKYYTLDICNEEEVAERSDMVVNDFGKIDGLFNIAGINHYGTVDEYTEADYNRLFAVNVSGTFGCCKYFGRKMRDQGHGSIVNIASVSGTICNRAPGPVSGYCASKAGVIQMTRALAAEFGADNVRVNSISPGWMEQRMSYSSGNRPTNAEFNHQIMVEGTPIKRYCKADELVGAAIYLLSDASTFTNGIDIMIDGGFHVW